MTIYNVLIADDEPLILHSLKSCLDWTNRGFAIVASCTNGIMALEQARRHRPHIILADIRMPGMNGLELMQTISREMPGTQGIFISGHADFSYAREAIRQEARAYLLKPIDPEELADALERARRWLDALSESAEGTPPPAEMPAEQSAYSGKLQRAIEYIDAHVCENLTLNATARALFISPTYLCQLFRREMNTTFTQYLSEKKMALACQMLNQPDAAIADVACVLGYSDYFYFHRVFKKVVGQSPGSYQNQKHL